MSSTITLTGHMTLSLQCKSRRASAEWYQRELGLKLLYDAAEIGWCELATPTEGINVGLAEVREPKVGAGAVPTFGVADLDAARAKLEARGVKFDGKTITIPNMVKLATFFDPDGNALMLFQSLAPTE